MRKLMVALVAMAMTAAAAFAETYTWVGPTDGTGSWNDVANWKVGDEAATALPGATDTAAFPTDFTEQLKVVLTESAAIGGISGHNVCICKNTGDSSKLTISHKVDVNMSSWLQVDVEITGDGSINLVNGNFTPNHANTFAGGITHEASAAGGIFVYNRDKPLGTGPVVITTRAVTLQIKESVSLPNDITFTCTSAAWGNNIDASGVTLTLTGTLDISACTYFRISGTFAFGDVKLRPFTYSGSGKDGYMYGMLLKPSYSSHTFNGKVTGYGLIATDADITYKFNSTGNEIADVDGWDNSKTVNIICGTENCFTDQTAIRLIGGTCTTVQKFDLGGFDQIVENACDYSSATPYTHKSVITSAKAAIVTMRSTKSRVFSGNLTGQAGLCWNPTNSTYALAMMGGTHTSTGKLWAKSGTIAFDDEASFTTYSELEIDAGATITFTANTVNPSLAKLTLAKGATMGLPEGVTEIATANLYTIDEEGKVLHRPAGNYTHAEIDAIPEGITVAADFDVYTYVGEDNGSWNVGANWDSGTVPSSDAKVIIPAGITKITVDADAGFGEFIREGGEALEIAAGQETQGKLTLGKAETVISSAASLTFNCELTGAGKLVSKGDGALYLNMANTYTGGTLKYNGAASKTTIWIGNSAALGTGAVVLDGSYFLSSSNGRLTVANDITFKVKAYIGGTSTNLNYTGNLDTTESKYIRCGTGAAFTGEGTTFKLRQVNAETDWENQFLFTGSFTFAKRFTNYGSIASDSAFTWRFAVAGNELAKVSTYNDSGNKWMYLDVADAFVDTTEVCLHRGSNQHYLMLEGHDQTLGSVYSVQYGGNSVGNDNEKITTTEAATLTMKGGQDRTFHGLLDGPLTLVWDPTGAYTYTVGGAAKAHTMSGAVVAKGGTLKFTDGSLAAISGIEVYNGATLEIADGVTINSSLAKMVIAEGATLTVPAETSVSVGEYWTADAAGNLTQQPRGRYQVGNLTLNVISSPDSAATWTGEGADTNFSTADNWSAAVDFGYPSVLATFAATGKTTATVDGNDQLRGIVFNTDGDFTIGGTDKLMIGKDGIDAQSAHVYTISAPVETLADMEVKVAENASLVMDGGLEGANKITTSGSGTVTFDGVGGDFDGELDLTGTLTYIKGNAMNGGEEGAITLHYGKQTYFSNATVTKPIVIEENPSTGTYGGGLFNGVTKTINEFRGAITLKRNYTRIYPAAGCTNAYSGGLYCENVDGSRGYVMLGAGYHLIKDVPMNITQWMSDSAGNGIFAVGGNKVSGSFTVGSTGYGTMRVETDNVFAKCGEFKLGNYGTMYLNGHDVNNISRMVGGCTGKITSDEPATFTIASMTSAIANRFSGAVSVENSGTAAVTLSGVSDTTGNVIVNGNTLTIAETGSFANASEAVVNAGTLALNSSTAFGRKTDVRIAEGAKLSLASGVVQVVRNLYLDGSATPVEPGDYSAAVDAEHFEGEGTLRVRGNSGFIILLK